MTVVLEHLTVEHVAEPLGVDVVPRFGWHVFAGEGGVVQKAWRLVVTGTDGVVWASGWNAGTASSEIEYAGDPLDTLSRYRWTVEVETTAGTAEATSEFVTGVLDDDWREAAWIAGTGGPAAPLLRTEFDLPATPLEAFLAVAAGGYARVDLNGRPAGPRHLSPGFTDYDVTVQYTVTDVLKTLTPGRNAIGVELGRGFYGMRGKNTWNWETAPWHAEPCVRVLLLVRDADGRETVMSSSPRWRTIDGPTRMDDLYAGEDYDARLERRGWSAVGHEDSDWIRAVVVSGPRGRLVNQRQQPIVIAESFAPERTVKLEPGRWVVSFPRVIAGWVSVEAETVNARSEEVVELRFGEKLRPDGTPNYDDESGYFDGRFQTDRITLGDGATQWEPRFTYKGFQHVEVRAPTLPRLTAQLVHTDARRTGRFACSEPLLNRLHELTVATVLNNLHGIPTDTPKYEKNGWTGDGLLGAELMLLNLDSHELLAKWSGDIAASRHGNGAPEVIAPHGGWNVDWSPAPTWHAALLGVPWEIYRQRGDRRVLAEIWPDAVDYLRFELARWPDAIADTTLADWVSPETDAGGGNAPEDTRIAASAFVIRMCDLAAQIAIVLDENPIEWREAAERFRRAFLREFYDVAGASICTRDQTEYRQGPAVLALAFDVLPSRERPRVADRLAQDVSARGNHLTTGALATKYLLPVLTRSGHTDVAWSVATQTTFPSWGYWVTHGATSLWEHWKLQSRSRGHYFLGTIDDWLFAAVAGLTPTGPGWQRARFAPALTSHLEWAEAEILTPQGRLAARWRRHDDSLTIDLEVPVGTTLDLDVPALSRKLGSGSHHFAM